MGEAMAEALSLLAACLGDMDAALDEGDEALGVAYRGRRDAMSEAVRRLVRAADGHVLPGDAADNLRVIEGHMDAVEAVIRRLDGMDAVAELLGCDAEVISEMLGG